MIGLRKFPTLFVFTYGFWWSFSRFSRFDVELDLVLTMYLLVIVVEGPRHRLFRLYLLPRWLISRFYDGYGILMLCCPQVVCRPRWGFSFKG